MLDYWKCFFIASWMKELILLILVPTGFLRIILGFLLRNNASKSLPTFFFFVDFLKYAFQIRAPNGCLNSQKKTNKCTYVKCVYQQIHVCKRFYIRVFVGLIVWTETLNTLRLCKVICIIVWGNSQLQNIALTKVQAFTTINLQSLLFTISYFICGYSQWSKALNNLHLTKVHRWSITT